METQHDEAIHGRLSDKPQRLSELRQVTVGLGSLGEEVEPLFCVICHRTPCGCSEPSGLKLSDLQKIAGSYRRMLEKYWNGGYAPVHERLIEDVISPDERVKHKPCQ